MASTNVRRILVRLLAGPVRTRSSPSPRRPIRRLRTARRHLAALFALAAACTSPTDAVGVRILSSEVTAPAPFVRTLRLELDQASELTVEYWAEGDAHLRVQAPLAQSASVVLTRLRPGKTYQYRVAGSCTSWHRTSPAARCITT